MKRDVINNALGICDLADFDVNMLNLTNQIRPPYSLRKYEYWRDRLEELRDAYQTNDPKTTFGFLWDQRNPTTMWGHRLAWIVGLVGLVALALSGAQLNVANKQLREEIKS